MGSTNPTLDFPVGFRFHPNDEELVNHYLNNKLLGNDSSVQIIPELDLCKIEPWQVPEYSVIKSDDPEWFFFSPQGYKYTKSKRFNRTTKSGYWKATGTDRKIKKRGTDKIIGTKKTLVFYRGRVPHGVKTNWVIHEYHAVTFDESQTNFVLCRLMKKAERKDEGEADAVTFDEREADAVTVDEGEPSTQMASDCENQEMDEEIPNFGTLPEVSMESIFQAPLESENHIPSTQLSPIGTEQEASFSNSQFSNDYFKNDNSLVQSPFETPRNDSSISQSPFETIGNDNSIMQSPFETIEEEDEFLSSMLADDDVGINEETRNAFVNGAIESESLRRVYNETSDADSALYGNILGTTLPNEHPPSSNEYNVSELLELPQDAVYSVNCLISWNNEADREKLESMFQDDFCGVGTSSCDSTADMPLEINCLEITSPPSTLRRWTTNQRRTRPNNFISQRNAARRSKKQRKVSSSAVSQLDLEPALSK